MKKQNQHQPTGALEYILVRHRSIVAALFLLPISVCANLLAAIRNKIVFLMNSAPKKHDEKVEKIRQQILEWRASGAGSKLCTARSPWATMSELVPNYKKTYQNIDINLYDVLDLREDVQTVRVEPQVNMGQITAALIPKGWTLPVVPELDDLTVGGLIMGFGVETSSHKYGLFQFICKSFDIITSDGQLRHCSEEENTDLFRSIPWSHGTLGFLVAAELKIIKASKYVRLTFQPIFSTDDLVKNFEAASRASQDNDFVEALTYGSGRSVLILGKMVNRVEDKGRVNDISRWYKPWFYRHVEEILNKKTDVTEFIPLRAYYHRHTRSFFWEMREVITFGNHPLFRFFCGWMMPPRIPLLKKLQTETIQKLKEKNHVVQDMLVPVTFLKESLAYFEKHYAMHPLWICPMAVYGNPQNAGFLKPFKKDDGSPDELFVDIGAYGSVRRPDFHGLEALRELERFVIDHQGYQALYARTLMSREQFRTMFDHTDYDRLRKEIPDCESAFDEVYLKVTRGRTEPYLARRGK